MNHGRRPRVETRTVEPAAGPTVVARRVARTADRGGRRQRVVALIRQVYAEVLKGRVMIAGVDYQEATPLYGAGSYLDSLGLVTLLVTLEQDVTEAFKSTVSLMDEQAMSLTHSPFRTIGTLADYIESMLP